jgi:hypothetical protein
VKPEQVQASLDGPTDIGGDSPIKDWFTDLPEPEHSHYMSDSMEIKRGVEGDKYLKE